MVTAPALCGLTLLWVVGFGAAALVVGVFLALPPTLPMTVTPPAPPTMLIEPPFLEFADLEGLYWALPPSSCVALYFCLVAPALLGRAYTTLCPPSPPGVDFWEL